MDAAPWRAAADGVTLAVRLTPKGGRDAVEGIGRDGAGRTHLRARVAAPPVDGAANAALVKLIAKALGLPKSTISITAGDAARVKTLRIAGDATEIEARLTRLI